MGKKVSEVIKFKQNRTCKTYKECGMKNASACNNKYVISLTWERHCNKISSIITMKCPVLSIQYNENKNINL
jgi:hypothetical protein